MLASATVLAPAHLVADSLHLLLGQPLPFLFAEEPLLEVVLLDVREGDGGREDGLLLGSVAGIAGGSGMSGQLASGSVGRVIHFEGLAVQVHVFVLILLHIRIVKAVFTTSKVVRQGAVPVTHQVLQQSLRQFVR